MRRAMKGLRTTIRCVGATLALGAPTATSAAQADENGAGTEIRNSYVHGSVSVRYRDALRAIDAAARFSSLVGALDRGLRRVVGHVVGTADTSADGGIAPLTSPRAERAAHVEIESVRTGRSPSRSDRLDG